VWSKKTVAGVLQIVIFFYENNIQISHIPISTPVFRDPPLSLHLAFWAAAISFLSGLGGCGLSPFSSAVAQVEQRPSAAEELRLSRDHAFPPPHACRFIAR